MKSRSARDAQLLVWSAWMLRGYLKRPKPSICPFEGAIGCILGSCLIVLQQSVNLHTTTQPKQPLGSGRLSPLKIECHSTIDRLNFESHSPSKNISHLSHLSGWEGGPWPRLRFECHSPTTKHLNRSRLSGWEGGPCPRLKVECHSPTTKHLNLSRLSGWEGGPCPRSYAPRKFPL